MYNFIRTILIHGFQAKNFQLLGWKGKFQTLFILNSLYVKSLIFKDKNVEITHKIFGYTISSYSYDFLLLLFTEIFIMQQYQFKASNSTPRIIDCGANIGMAVIYFKILYPNSEIVAFEPNPNVFALLEKNISQNNIQGVHLRNEAVSDEEGKIEFFVGEYLGSMVGSTVMQRGGENVHQVDCVKLSSLLKDEMAHLVKIDIEGAEIQVLNDLVSTGTIKNSNQYIIEFHHNILSSNHSLADFLKAFENNDFKFSLKSTYTNPWSFQDILLNFISKTT